MSSIARHRLLEFEERTSTVTSESIPTLGREQWVFHFDLGASAGSITIEIKASVDGEDWTSIHSEARTVPETWDVAGSTDGGGLQVEEFYRFLRVSVTAAAGAYLLEVVAEAPFLYAQHPDLDELLSQETRFAKEGLPRFIQRAETEVLQAYDWNDEVGGDLGRLDLEDPRAQDRLERAIAAQTEWVVLRHRLMTQGADATDRKTLRDMAQLAPEIETLLGPIDLGAKPAKFLSFAGRG